MARKADKLFWGVVAASGLVAIVTMVTIWLNPETPPRGVGVSLPRMRGPVGNVPLGALLRSMGVGSLTWYASFLSAPLFISLSRRFPSDRGRWPFSLAVHLTAVLGL